VKNAGRLAAFALPLAGLAALWGWSDYQSRQGTDWLVPIGGYDPRDLLRGHYVQYAYDWPGLDGAALRQGGPAELCLHGAAPRLERVSHPAPGAPCEHRARAFDAGRAYPTGLSNGRVYIAQTRSEELTRNLADPDLRGFVVLRQREDGTITPRVLRFRPLTEAERQAREADVTRPPIEIETP
jgi:hypothetical protein